MAFVFRACHLTSGKAVALKLMQTRSAERRFDRESGILARLRHPGIVRFHERGRASNMSYYTMELVDGGTLEDLLARRPQCPYFAAKMVETLARAMHAAHRQGIVHRDLKPANVLLTRDGNPKISDFGIAHDLCSTARSVPVEGSPCYMA